MTSDTATEHTSLRFARTGSWPRIRVTSRVGASVQPLRLGIPFARGQVHDLGSLGLHGPAGEVPGCQWRALLAWPDGSIQWALLDAVLRTTEREGIELEVSPRADRSSAPLQESSAPISGTADAWVLQPLGWKLKASARGWLSEASPSAPASTEVSPVRWSCVLVTEDGQLHSPTWESAVVEENGPQTATIVWNGSLFPPHSTRRAAIRSRVTVRAGLSAVRVEITVHNPCAAKHPGGLWDLGDEASLLFRRLSVGLTTAGEGTTASIRPEPLAGPCHVASRDLKILQASSGGERWMSRNHVDRHGVVPLPFRGWRLEVDGRTVEGLRASPVASLERAGSSVRVAVERFWQQFPRALRYEHGSLDIDLFAEGAGIHELQGGEQKTHVFWVELGVPEEPAALSWVHSPARVCLDPAYVAATGASGKIAPAALENLPEYAALVDHVVQGPDSFFAKREVIDEFGWRNFGDVYADHENQHFDGEKPVISHYNNQYDLVYGLLRRFLATADWPWYELGDDLARHVVDIDIYHTNEDKAAYSGGLFWHTDHYVDANRSTHRTYSKDSPQARAGAPYGGGPANEHNYTSGLTLHYLLTGNPASRDTVLGLAQWVLNMDDGKRTILGVVDPGPSGGASSTYTPLFHGPGRGAGNSINALLDAYRLSQEPTYLARAEELVRRVIHPEDDPTLLGLKDPESRWSYLVFLQVLGKYLDFKVELGAQDRMFHYARASLLQYAAWMAENEVPYIETLDRVEYPTETWPAHDVRKSVVFDFAAYYGPSELREKYLERSRFFHKAALDGLSRFATRTQTRPLAILLQSGGFRAAFELLGPSKEKLPSASVDLGRPSGFVPQKVRVKNLLRSPVGWVRIAARLMIPSNFVRVVRFVLSKGRT